MLSYMLSGMFDPGIVIKLERVSVLLCLYQEYPLPAVAFAKAPFSHRKQAEIKNHEAQAS